MGGKDKFIQKLDTLFNIQADMSKIHFSDVSGMIGQYAHGNEPSHHVAYLYDYAGAPWKTQKTVAMVRDSLYKATTDGICGNDDCGQISAWYIFSVLGFYPVNPASGIYEIGTPAFDSISIQTASGKIFMVKARNISAKNIYIQSAIFNGKPFNKVYISHKEIMDGGVLEFEMGDSPNKTWGNNDDV
jgi:predicted alpha-1,2-mannosidase